MRITGSKVLWGFQLSIAYAKNGDFQKQCLGSLLGFIFSKKLLLQSDGSGRNSRRDRGQQTIFFSCKSSDCAYLQIIKTALWTIPIMKAKENSAQQKWDGLPTTNKTPLEKKYIYIYLGNSGRIFVENSQFIKFHPAQLLNWARWEQAVCTDRRLERQNVPAWLFTPVCFMVIWWHFPWVKQPCHFKGFSSSGTVLCSYSSVGTRYEVQAGCYVLLPVAVCTESSTYRLMH